MNLYFQSYEPVKRVTQEINLSDLIGCFDTREPDIDCLLSDMTEATQFKLSVDVAELAPVNIKPSTPESLQLDLANLIFLVSSLHVHSIHCVHVVCMHIICMKYALRKLT